MSDDLLRYYHRELAFIRRLGGEFADKHPDVAAALQLGKDACEDPHVERMIMAFAYLNARIRRKLDDDFPELTNAFLGVLYPHYQAPTPSMAIVEFELDRGQGGLTKGYSIDRQSELETEPIRGEPCRFRTSYPVTLWPIEVTSAHLGGLPFDSAVTAEDASVVLRINLKCFADDMTFSKLEMSTLRFFLNGQGQHVLELYELLFNNIVEVVLANAEGDKNPRLLGPDSIQTVGFGRDEEILPYSPRSFSGYRILSEYFAFPQKFCFFDLVGLNEELLENLGNQIQLRFYLNRTSSELEHNISESTFRLGCTPVVNLFSTRAEPIRLTQTESEYRIEADARRPMAVEVYSVDRVTGASPGGDEVEYQPFYSFKHAVDRKSWRTFWYAERRPSRRDLHRVDHGTEVYLDLVDLGFSATTPADWTVVVEATCLNRDLPKRLPFGGNQPILQLVDGGPISGINCLTKPTPTHRPELEHGAMWRLVSHLTLNHLSIAGPDARPDALQEILTLYDHTESRETKTKIAGILEVSSRRIVGRLQRGLMGGFCRGMEVTILFNEEHYSDKSLFMFASVLERFLGLYCSVNSFTKLVAKTKQRDGVLREWRPRAAEQVLI